PAQDDIVHNIEFDYFDGEVGDGPEDDAQDEPDAPEGAEEFLLENENEPEEKSKTNTSIIIVAIILVLAIIGLSVFLIYLPLREGVSPAEYMRRLFDTTARIGAFLK
ncbi:MAG: hypothetical protein IK086_01230, partial [Clostridia bacterium]|nr:hypothetical protein [Clostridia bacterium]